MRSGLARASCSPADPEGHLSCAVAQVFKRRTLLTGRASVTTSVSNAATPTPHNGSSVNPPRRPLQGWALKH